MHYMWKGTRFSPSLLFVVVVWGESLGTRLALQSNPPHNVTLTNKALQSNTPHNVTLTNKDLQSNLHTMLPWQTRRQSRGRQAQGGRAGWIWWCWETSPGCRGAAEVAVCTQEKWKTWSGWYREVWKVKPFDMLTFSSTVTLIYAKGWTLTRSVLQHTIPAALKMVTFNLGAWNWDYAI